MKNEKCKNRLAFWRMLLVFNFTFLIFNCVEATTLKVNTRDFTSEPTQRRRTTLTLIEAGPVVAGPWLIAGDSVSRFTDTNGVAWYSNVLAGSYRLDVAGTPGRSFPLSVFDTNEIVEASAIVNNTNANPNFYTATQIDALLAAVTAGGGSGETNFLASVGTDTSLVADKAANTNRVKSLAVSGGMLSIGSTDTNVTINLTEGAVVASMTELGAIFNNRETETTLLGGLNLADGFLTVQNAAVFDGNVTSTGGNFIGDGSLLTSLNAGQLSTGAIPPARMATNAASDGKMLFATSATTAKWDDAPEGGGVPVTDGSSTNQFLQGPTLNNAAFTGTTTVNTLYATNLAGNASGLTNIIGDGRVTTSTNVWIGGASVTEIPFVSATAPNGATNGVALDTDPDFAWNNSTKSLELGQSGGVGSVTFWDTYHSDMDSSMRMFDGLFNTRGITFSNGYPDLKWYLDGNSYTVLDAQFHNSYEPILYWGGYDFSGMTFEAQAFLIGGNSTNGPRFSFLLGELGHTWNLASPTNGSDWSSFKVGLSGPSQGNAIGWSSASNTVVVGNSGDSTFIRGSTNSLTISSDGLGGVGYFPHGAMFTSGGNVSSVTGTPTAVGSFSGSYSSRFGVNTSTGRMTNDVAGLYEIHYSFQVFGDEISPATYTLQVYTNDVACAPTLGTLALAEGYAGVASKSVVLQLPAGTWCEVRFSSGGSFDASLQAGSFYIRRL